MSPHNDAPSPAGSFIQSFNEMSFRPSVGSGLRRSNAYADSDSSDSVHDVQVLTDRAIRPLVPGIYVPTVCFFEPTTEDLDLDKIAFHAVKLAKAGVTGLTTQGSNGEAVHLSRHERQLVTKTTREALRSAGFADMPVIVGCGAQSTRETIALCQEAYEAGGDYALVLPPSYYQGLFAPKARSVIEFFTTVADASPIPLLIYNYPGAVSGMDLSSDIIIELSRHENIKGVKLTCGNTGKLNRIAAATKGPVNADGAPDFIVLGGSADFELQSLIGGGHGILAGLANISPKACVKMMELYNAGKIAEAQQIQEVVARGDWAVIQGGIVGTKAAMEGCFGYGGYARSPLPRPDAAETQAWAEKFKELLALEKSL